MKIKVFYSPKLISKVKTFSPSPSKPAKVVADWKRHRLAIEVCKVKPVTAVMLCAAHSAQYVDDVLHGEVNNGFGSRDAETARSLLYTSGAMLQAAREAVSNGRVACAPVSGFHHAGYRFGGGFCTFNGLAVAAGVLHSLGTIKRAAILDLDYHYGNGTDDIISSLGWRKWLTHISPGMEKKANAEKYLRHLPKAIAAYADKADVLLYQAGADAHVNDPLGGWMTTEQLARRDEIVFKTARTMGVPVAWNLAGGYQQNKSGGIPAVLEIHRNTMQKCIEVYGND